MRRGEPCSARKRNTRAHIDIHTVADGRNGLRYVLSVMEASTSYVLFFPMPNQSAAEVCKAFAKALSFFGIFKEIHSDQGTQFLSQQFVSLLNRFHIKLLTTTHCAQGAGRVERSHRTLSDVLARAIAKDPDHTRWPDYLPLANLLLNLIPDQFGLSPYEKMFGIPARTALSAYLPHFYSDDVPASIRAMHENINKILNQKQSQLRENSIAARTAPLDSSK